MPTKCVSRATEAQAVEAGVSDAFHHWLEWHEVTAPDAVARGVQAAVGKWLDDNGYRLELTIKEEIGNIVRESVP
jgi:hypothetical protein